MLCWVQNIEAFIKLCYLQGILCIVIKTNHFHWQNLSWVSVLHFGFFKHLLPTLFNFHRPTIHFYFTNTTWQFHGFLAFNYLFCSSNQHLSFRPIYLMGVTCGSTVNTSNLIKANWSVLLKNETDFLSCFCFFLPSSLQFLPCLFLYYTNYAWTSPVLCTTVEILMCSFNLQFNLTC